MSKSKWLKPYCLLPQLILHT